MQTFTVWLTFMYGQYLFLPCGSQELDIAPRLAGIRPLAYSCCHTIHRGVPGPPGPSIWNSLSYPLYSCKPPLVGNDRQRHSNAISGRVQLPSLTEPLKTHLCIFGWMVGLMKTLLLKWLGGNYSSLHPLLHCSVGIYKYTSLVPLNLTCRRKLGLTCPVCL